MCEMLVEDSHRSIQIARLVTVPLLLETVGNHELPSTGSRERPDESELEGLEFPERPPASGFQFLEPLAGFDSAEFRQSDEGRLNLGPILRSEGSEKLSGRDSPGLVDCPDNDPPLT